MSIFTLALLEFLPPSYPKNPKILPSYINPIRTRVRDWRLFGFAEVFCYCHFKNYIVGKFWKRKLESKKKVSKRFGFFFLLVSDFRLKNLREEKHGLEVFELEIWRLEVFELEKFWRVLSKGWSFGWKIFFLGKGFRFLFCLCFPFRLWLGNSGEFFVLVLLELLPPRQFLIFKKKKDSHEVLER